MENEQKIISQLLNENESLKKQNKTLKMLQSTLIDELEVENIIKVVYRKGSGASDDPVRICKSYFDLNGKHLFSN